MIESRMLARVGGFCSMRSEHFLVAAAQQDEVGFGAAQRRQACRFTLQQGAYFEQMLLLPGVLGEFRSLTRGDGRAKRIVGFDGFN